MATEFSRLLQFKDDKQIKAWFGKIIRLEVVKSKGKTKGNRIYINPFLLKILTSKKRINEN